jgi:hypothetical protein
VHELEDTVHELRGDLKWAEDERAECDSQLSELIDRVSDTLAIVGDNLGQSVAAAQKRFT